MSQALEQQAALKGIWHVRAYDRDGQLKSEFTDENLIVNGGLAWLAGALSGDVASPEAMKYLGLGTGDTAAAGTDTALETEVESRVAGTQSRVTTTTTNDTYQVEGTFTFTDARAVTEYGLFSAASDGTMLNRLVRAVNNMAAGEQMVVTCKIIMQRPTS